MTEYVLTILDADKALRCVKHGCEVAGVLVAPAAFDTIFDDGYARLVPHGERAEGLLRVALIWNGIPYEAFQPEVI